MPVPQGVASSPSASFRTNQSLPDFDGLDLAILAADTEYPVLAEVAGTLLWRVGSPARGAFYEDAPYVPVERPSLIR